MVTPLDFVRVRAVRSASRSPTVSSTGRTWVTAGSCATRLTAIPANITPLLFVNEPVGIAVTSTHIYWSSETGGAIGRMDLNGGDVAPEFHHDRKQPFRDRDRHGADSDRPAGHQRVGGARPDADRG